MIVPASSTSSPRCTASAVTSVTRAAEQHLDAELFERRLGVGRKALAEIGEDARTGLDEDDARFLGLIERNSLRSVVRASSMMAPESSTPVGPAPMMAKVSSARRRAEIGFALGRLEGEQQAPPHRGRILQRLEAGGVGLPVVMAEIGVARTGGDHQRVVRDAAAILELDHLVRLVDAGDLAEQRRHFRAVLEQHADRPARSPTG